MPVGRLIWLSFLVLSIYSDSLSQCWVYQKSSTSVALNGIAFPDSVNGWAVGDAGVILHTSNAGVTWTHQFSHTTAQLTAVSFADSRFGMVVGDTGVAYRTSDGGSTWVRQTVRTHLSLRAVAVIDSLHAIAISVFGIHKTIDGGQSWWQVTSYSAFGSVFFITPLIGYVAGFPGKVMKTTDGGYSWFDASAGGGSFLYGPCMADTNNGFACSSAGGLYRTTDGGAHWSSQSTDASNWLQGTACLNRDTVVVVGFHPVGNTFNGVILLSQDGGITWSPMKNANYGYYFAAAAPHGFLYVCGENGVIMRLSYDCGTLPSPISPADHNPRQAITTFNGVRSIRMQWSYIPFITIQGIHVQISDDSTFSQTLSDITITQSISPAPATTNFLNPLARKDYFWRMKIDYIDTTSTGWMSPWRFSTAGGKVSGTLYNDENADGLLSPGEGPLANRRFDLGGDATGSTWSDSTGAFTFIGLDSGSYSVSEQPQSIWIKTFPAGNGYAVSLGPNDSATARDFLNRYPWNHFAGTVYYDRNQNGLRDPDEPGMPNFLVRVQGDTFVDSAFTDSSGVYTVRHVDPGQNTETLIPIPDWEQMTPQFSQGFSFDVQTYDQTYIDLDFGVRRIPARVKIALTVRDNTLITNRQVWFGVRPAASYGIWGVDPSASNFDFSENEFEIPPPTPGLFDARFVDPRGGPRFGAGSWTDMRDFFSTTQNDSFKLTFAPASFFGGDYPMVIEWVASAVRNAFPNGALLWDRYGHETPMTVDNVSPLIIADRTITSLIITTYGTSISPVFLKRWHMVSVPGAPSDPRLKFLLPTSSKYAYIYKPGTGYVVTDSLQAGSGYWINYRNAIDSLRYDPNAFRIDSIGVSAGWNLIGALSAPLSVHAVQTVPPDIITSPFFRYSSGYSPADSLRPGEAYWIRTSGSGLVVLNASAAPSALRLAESPETDTLLIEDFLENRQPLLIARNPVRMDYAAPPPAPSGAFDARFASQALLEVCENHKDLPLSISGASYPLKISWHARFPLSASLDVDGKVFRLTPSAPIRLQEPPSSIVLKIFPSNPARFALEQNFPNPFNPVTTIRYALPVNARTVVTIFDLLGREVEVLVNDDEEAGFREIRWDASRLSSGVYFCRLEAFSRASKDHFSDVRKLILLR